MSRKFNKRIYASNTVNLATSSVDKKIPAHISMEASLDIQAAKDGENSPPEFTLIANTGVPMQLAGFYDPVIIDIAGAKFSRKVTPVIADHDTGKRIGHSTRQVIIPAGSSKKIGKEEMAGPLVFAKGVVSSRMGIAQGFVEDAKAGFPFQVSVGSDIVEAFYVDDGEKVEVNGKTYKGPLIVASKTSIMELSITVLGADGNTSAQIAARHHPDLYKESSMNPFQQWLKASGFVEKDLTDDQLKALKAQWEAANPPTDPPAAPSTPPVKAKATPPGNPETPNPEEYVARINAAAAKNQLRVDQCNVLFAQHSAVEKVTYKGKEVPLVNFKAAAIQDGLEPDQVELILIKAGYPTAPSGPAIHMAPGIEDLGTQAISCALVRQLGVKASKTQKWSGEKYGYEHAYDEQALEASNHRSLRGLTLHQLMDMTIHASGSHYSGSRKSNDFIQATREALRKIHAGASGSTTLDISNIFEDAANKMLLTAYQGIDTTWQEIAAVKSVSDFKTHNMYRLISKGSYHVVGADGQLEHGEWDDQKYTVAADTYGKIVGLDRKHLINDDLDAFAQIMTMLGTEAAKALEELVYVTWMTLLGTTYTAGQGNYISGAATDLGIDGLTLATQEFDKQVIDDAPLMVGADRLLVGTQDRILASRLYNQARTEATGSTDATVFVDNPHVGDFRPIVTPYLNNTKVKQRVDVNNLGAAIPGQSSNMWFLFANPSNSQGATINVALLNGNRVPFLEQADANFDTLGLRWRGYHDFGVGIGDPILSLMSKGAA